MRKLNTLAAKRNSFKPNERRRQTWRKHHMALIDQRSKWYYQQGWSDNDGDACVTSKQDDVTQPEAVAKQEPNK